MSSRNLSPIPGINAELAQRLLTDEKFRNRFIERWAQSEVASEIRSMRKRRSLLQGELAALIGTRQSGISRIEQADYDAWTFQTLLGIAIALKSRLRIRLEPIEQVAQGYLSTSGDTAIQSGELYKADTGAKFSSISVTSDEMFVLEPQSTADNFSHQVN